MSRAASKAGKKAGRRDRHVASERARKERKRLRRQRGEIHRALVAAEQDRKARKKGKGEVDKTMLKLGYRRVSNDGTLDEKYEAIL